MTMLDRFVREHWRDPLALADSYQSAAPFPHIVMENFLDERIVDAVACEFPDMRSAPSELVQEFANQAEVKFASNGSGLLSPAAFELVSFLNSDCFLNYLQQLTGVAEPLISDPYLAGGGYHEIKRGGLLKIHADFNRHPRLELDRRLNLLLYLNRDWDESWGGDLQLFDQTMQGEPVVRVYPHFNTCVLFSTTSFTYHGHPDPLACPEDRSRRSLALYYFSTGRPAEEISDVHDTLFKRREGESFEEAPEPKPSLLQDLCPPLLLRLAKRLLGRA
jgi:hypothetical protein